MPNENQRTATVLSKQVICKQRGKYIGWPTVAKTRHGELLVAFSGDRDAHLCPWGKTYMVRSRDDGSTWTEPALINNTPLDDRDAGILQTQKGTLLLTWFSSTLFQSAHKFPPRFRRHVTPEMLTCWKRHQEKVTAEIIEEWRHSWIRRSDDGGATWGNLIKLPGHAPHGPIELSDGRLLYVGSRGHWVAESTDDGRTWKKIGSIPRSASLSAVLDEPHAVEAADGKLLTLFRYEPPQADQRFMHQSESTDGGKTWSTAHPTTIWADNPPHLIRLKDNRLLVVYGRRTPPYGQRACVSHDDGGAAWDSENEIILGEAPNNDLGYPASVQLDDGSILTVYYQPDSPDEKPCLMGTYWRLEP